MEKMRRAYITFKNLKIGLDFTNKVKEDFDGSLKTRINQFGNLFHKQAFIS